MDVVLEFVTSASARPWLVAALIGLLVVTLLARRRRRLPAERSLPAEQTESALTPGEGGVGALLVPEPVEQLHTEPELPLAALTQLPVEEQGTISENVELVPALPAADVQTVIEEVEDAPVSISNTVSLGEDIAVTVPAYPPRRSLRSARQQEARIGAWRKVRQARPEGFHTLPPALEHWADNLETRADESHTHDEGNADNLVLPAPVLPAAETVVGLRAETTAPAGDEPEPMEPADETTAENSDSFDGEADLERVKRWGAWRRHRETETLSSESETPKPTQLLPPADVDLTTYDTPESVLRPFVRRNVTD